MDGAASAAASLALDVRVLDLTPGKIPEAASELSKIENVVEIHETHSSGDLLVKVRAKSLDELGALVANGLRKISSIRVNGVAPVLRIWKDSLA
jgi:DNA-binding Lrp family transcriptional regulator